MARRTRSTSHRRGKYFTQEGVALIAVSVALSIAGVFVTEFSTNTNVDLYASKNAENDMKAHFLARSSMNLSELIIKLEQRLERAMQQQSGQMPGGMGGFGAFKLTDYAGTAMALFGGSKEEANDWMQLLGPFAGDSIETLGVPEGSFSVEFSSEDGKINVNCGHDSSSSNTNAQSLALQLWGLFQPEAYNPIFENEDAENWRRDRETQIAAIVDYVDRGRSRYEYNSDQRSSAPEDYGYDSLDDKYEAKNQRLDTTGEIKQIRGIDDRLWNLLGGNLTVYGDCEARISAISDPLRIFGILRAVVDEKDPIAQNPQQMWTLARAVLFARDMGIPMNKRGEFKQFVSDPVTAIEQILAFISMDQTTTGQPDIPFDMQLLRPAQINDTQLNAIVSDEDLQRTYRVEAIATIGQMDKRIVAIWDTKAPTNQDTRYPGNVENPSERGAWVYWRED